MYVNADIEIEINEDDMAEAIVDSRYFTSAVEAVVENMDLNDILDAPSRSDVEIIIEDMDVPTRDDVYDIVRDILRDEGLLRESQVTLQAQARIEALEQQVLRLEGTLARVADVLLGKPVERIVSATIPHGPTKG